MNLAFLETLVIVTIFGEDLKFWSTIGVGLLLKWLFSPSTGTLRESLSGRVAGASLAYYGADWVVDNVESLTYKDRNLVIIGLVISGEHFVRALVSYGPQILAEKFGLQNKEEKDE
jgi:hypothetical protein